ncbi:MAG: hypothetical protein M1827_003277 [Pycnora praestabilis]|nr:MAG: hypothetical protein M1827_003277 [Pycnora praestabilis]
MANFRGLSERTGKRAKQMTKQANAPTLHAPNTRSLSHLLTILEDQHAPRGRRNWGSITTSRTLRSSQDMQYYSQANHPSSSSLRFGAGSGAPGFSAVGSLTYPPSPNGFRDCSLESIGVDEDVLTGMSGSRRDQPIEFMESRKDVDAMLD